MLPLNLLLKQRYIFYTIKEVLNVFKTLFLLNYLLKTTESTKQSNEKFIKIKKSFLMKFFKKSTIWFVEI